MATNLSAAPGANESPSAAAMSTARPSAARAASHGFPAANTSNSAHLASAFANSLVFRRCGPETTRCWLSGSPAAATFFANAASAVLTSSETAFLPPGRKCTFFHHVTLRGSRNGGVEKESSALRMSESCKSAFVEFRESTTSSPTPSPTTLRAAEDTR